MTGNLEGFLFLLCVIFPSTFGHLLVGYWGQNSGGNTYPNNYEKDLAEVCRTRSYDVIVVGFVVTFFEPRNKDQLPSINLASHCGENKGPEYPFLLNCPKTGQGIKECQKRGIKVLMSLGGATGNNRLTDSSAKKLAKTLWDLYLGGTEMKNLRPFGDAVMDGVDLDIEDHQSGGYSQLVKSLRALMNKDSGKKYLITAAPQCPYPDASLGPAPGRALSDQAKQFDHVYVQFYNNYCYPGDEAQFWPNVKRWLSYASDSDGPKIFVGLPAHVKASGKSHYHRSLAEVKNIYQKLSSYAKFGGFMLWDVSWDQNNLVGGKPYGDNLKQIMTGSGGQEPNKPDKPDKPDKPNKPDKPEKPDKPDKPDKSDKPDKPDKPEKPNNGPVSKEFCRSKEDGLYAHPNSCRKFVTCLSGKAFVQSCPAGLVFHPKNKHCDWPANVPRCNRRRRHMTREK